MGKDENVGSMKSNRADHADISYRGCCRNRMTPDCSRFLTERGVCHRHRLCMKLANGNSAPNALISDASLSAKTNDGLRSCRSRSWPSHCCNARYFAPGEMSLAVY